MVAVLCKVDVHLPAVHSLKAKRSLINKIKTRTQNKFSVMIAEVGAHDLLQRTSLGFAFVGSDATHLHHLADETVRFMDDLGLGETLGVEREMVRL